MAFHVGQKVVCILDFPDRGLSELQPVKGSIYTVRAIDCFPQGEALRLYELVNIPGRYAEGVGETSFGTSAFRPVVERKTDISIFQQMLTPSTNKVDA